MPRNSDSVPTAPSSSSSASPISSPVIAAPIQEATAPAAEFLIVPGERVGQITATTSFEDLVRLYGAERLTNQQFSVGEGEMRPATRIDLGETRSLTVIWKDENRTQAEAVSQLGTDWKTAEGIGMDSTLADLQAVLGSFQLYGFGWDYSGTVVLTGTKLAQYNNLLILRLAPQPGTIEARSADFEAVMGDQLFNSDNPHLQALYPSVNRIIVRLSRN
ncbi:hypothetical protein [Leptolyngbya ohadii]|uniref:hypothetical protein n=1 Tax=Leptolyngbya ohadii TaxID=1962290 RepID=UPI00117B90FC|nr:hypothetical protein [Leptolyngbya ohadii]